jgi:hypothetical protein
MHDKSGRARVFGGLRKNPPAIQGVIDDLPNRGGIGINIHPIACAEVPDDSFCGNLERDASQF